MQCSEATRVSLLRISLTHFVFCLVQYQRYWSRPLSKHGQRHFIKSAQRVKDQNSNTYGFTFATHFFFKSLIQRLFRRGTVTRERNRCHAGPVDRGPAAFIDYQITFIMFMCWSLSVQISVFMFNSGEGRESFINSMLKFYRFLIVLRFLSQVNDSFQLDRILELFFIDLKG